MVVLIYCLPDYLDLDIHSSTRDGKLDQVVPYIQPDWHRET